MPVEIAANHESPVAAADLVHMAQRISVSGQCIKRVRLNLERRVRVNNRADSQPCLAQAASLAYGSYRSEPLVLVKLPGDTR